MSARDSLRLIELTPDRIDEIVFIENSSYPNPWSRELLLNEFNKEISLRPALELNGVIVAQSFSHLVLDELHILNLAVHPDFRRKGIGRELLRQLLSTGYRKGATHALLEVRVSNAAAQELYRSFGFQQVGIRKAYYADNREDALLLVAMVTNTP